MSQHLWEHYLYNGDKKYLQSVYPILRGAVLFYVDFLVKHPKYQWLVVNPGMSPENAPKAHEGTSLDAGATMDNQIVFDIFSTTIRAAEILNSDKSFTDSLKTMRKSLAPMHIGQHGLFYRSASSQLWDLCPHATMTMMAQLRLKTS